MSPISLKVHQLNHTGLKSKDCNHQTLSFPLNYLRNVNVNNAEKNVSSNVYLQGYVHFLKQFPRQKQSVLHLTSAIQHLHGGLHSFLHWHVTKSLRPLEMGGMVVHKGAQLVSFFIHPHCEGSGRTGHVMRACPQT